MMGADPGRAVTMDFERRLLLKRGIEVRNITATAAARGSHISRRRAWTCCEMTWQLGAALPRGQQLQLGLRIYHCVLSR